MAANETTPAFRIKYYHKRRYVDAENFLCERDDEGARLLPTGGMCTCKIFLNDRLLVEAHAYCNNADNYNKKIGRNISLGRVQKKCYGG